MKSNTEIGSASDGMSELIALVNSRSPDLNARMPAGVSFLNRALSDGLRRGELSTVFAHTHRPNHPMDALLVDSNEIR
jgi:hypothetical protein